MSTKHHDRPAARWSRAAIAASTISLCAASALAQSSVTLPPATGNFDYQLAGRYVNRAGVSIVSSDPGIDVRTGIGNLGRVALDPAAYNICYLNAFQTQPQDATYWTATHGELILMQGGKPVHDEDRDWKGELLFDVSTGEKRDALLAIEAGWISECKRLGFKAIEPDNIDSYTRSKRLLSVDAAQSFMTMLAAEAHRQGLAVAQKNVADWVREPGKDGQLRAASVGFDFALVEECQLTGDCASLLEYYRDPKRVLEVEYWYDEDDSSSGVTVTAFTEDHFIEACAARGSEMRIVMRNRNVRPSGAPGYVGKTCDMLSPGTSPLPTESDDPAPQDPPEDGSDE